MDIKRIVRPLSRRWEYHFLNDYLSTFFLYFSQFFLTSDPSFSPQHPLISYPTTPQKTRHNPHPLSGIKARHPLHRPARAQKRRNEKQPPDNFVRAIENSIQGKTRAPHPRDRTLFTPVSTLPDQRCQKQDSHRPANGASLQWFRQRTARNSGGGTGRHARALTLFLRGRGVF